MRPHRPNISPRRRQLLLVAFIVLALYILLPQLGDFRSSWHLVRHPRAGDAGLAVALTFATYVAAAGTYRFLAFRRLPYWRTALVQLAAMFMNRLLPAGIGALGANYLYLRQERHNRTLAAAIVAMNNLLGFVGHALLVAVTLVLSSDRAWQPSSTYGSGLSAAALLKIVGVIAVAALVLGLLLGRRKLFKELRAVKEQLMGYRRRLWHLLAALGTSLALTLCNVLCLLYCLHALGGQLSFAAVLLVFTLGAGAGSAVPTPGGLGGFEAGLAAGFVAYGLDPSAALATALLYRLVSYWLPLAAGAPALLWCQHRQLFGVSGGY